MWGLASTPETKPPPPLKVISTSVLELYLNVQLNLRAKQDPRDQTEGGEILGKWRRVLTKNTDILGKSAIWFTKYEKQITRPAQSKNENI